MKPESVGDALLSIIADLADKGRAILETQIKTNEAAEDFGKSLSELQDFLTSIESKGADNGNDSGPYN